MERIRLLKWVLSLKEFGSSKSLFISKMSSHADAKVELGPSILTGKCRELEGYVEIG